MMRAEFEKSRMEEDLVAVTFQHGAADVVVQSDPGHPDQD